MILRAGDEVIYMTSKWNNNWIGIKCWGTILKVKKNTVQIRPAAPEGFQARGFIEVSKNVVEKPTEEMKAEKPSAKPESQKEFPQKRVQVQKPKEKKKPWHRRVIDSVLGFFGGKK